MKVNQRVGIRVLALAISLALTSLPSLAQAPGANQKAAAAKPVAATAKTEAARPGEQAARPSGGPQEGIKVHGHWVIEVRNPDGTLAARREFENLLQANGPRALAEVLAHNGSAGDWFVAMQGGACFVPNVPAVCAISQSTYAFAPAVLQRTLGATQMFSGLQVSSASGQLTLTGSARTSRAGQISAVATFLTKCSGDTFCTAAASPDPNDVNHFSGTTLTNPIPVVQNQTIDVTVTFSFS